MTTSNVKHYGKLCCPCLKPGHSCWSSRVSIVGAGVVPHPEGEKDVVPPPSHTRRQLGILECMTVAEDPRSPALFSRLQSLQMVPPLLRKATVEMSTGSDQDARFFFLVSSECTQRPLSRHSPATPCPILSFFACWVCALPNCLLFVFLSSLPPHAVGFVVQEIHCCPLHQ